MPISAIFPSLRGKLVIITGGASGIGEAFTRAFVAQGARVVFLDIDEAAGARLANQLESSDQPPLFIRADVTDIDALERALHEIQDAMGAVGVLINNAASDRRHSMEEVTPESWGAAIDVNVRHHFFASRAVRERMAASGGGSIINMGSCSWFLGLGGMPVYLAAKAAVAGLTRALATELGPERIRVNSIVPGFVKIERTVRDFLTPQFHAEMLANQCLPDLVGAEDVAAMALFLAADDSARCTSQNYAVDGGWM